jgi:hypothetical protein
MFVLETKDSQRAKWRRVKYLAAFATREAAQGWIDDFDNGGGQGVFRITEL